MAFIVGILKLKSERAPHGAFDDYTIPSTEKNAVFVVFGINYTINLKT